MADKDVNLENKDGKLDKDVDEIKFSPAEQAKVDAIIKGRLKTVGVKHDEELKKAKISSRESLAKQFGIEVSEMEQILQGNINSKKLEAVAEQAAKLGVDPEFLVKINDVTAENATLKAKENARNELIKVTQDAESEFDTQLENFGIKYPEIDFTKLNKDPQFNKMYKRLGKTVTLIEAYDTYSDIVGEVRTRDIANKARKDERHVGGGENLSTDDAYSLLDKDQKALCKQNDIDPVKFLATLQRSIYFNKK